jgi:hypothetical protein
MYHLLNLVGGDEDMSLQWVVEILLQLLESLLKTMLSRLCVE